MKGTFSIRIDGEAELASGYITSFLGADGNELDYPHHAAEYVGYVLEGPGAGTWIRFPASDDDRWKKVIPS